MKYKLINNITKEEHLCDKITIEGFDYYVRKGFVLVTNNPNIVDIPKVIDEIEYFAKKHSTGYEQIKGFKKGYNKLQQTHPFNMQDMIEFYEWCNFPIYRASGDLGFNKRVQPQFPDYNTYVIIDEKGCSIKPKGVFLTTEELIEIWGNQRTITLYYE